MALATTIKVQNATKEELNKFREYRAESYDDVIKKLVFIAKKCKSEPKLSKQTIIDIEAARERMKKGEFLTMNEMKKRLGLDV